MDNEKKLTIIKAAVKRFSKHGLKKTTLEEIARDLRIGKATLYHYFNSKDELYYETVKWEIEYFISDIKNIFNDETTDFNQKLFSYFSLKISIEEKYNLIYQLLIHSLTDFVYEKEEDLLNLLFNKELEILNLILNARFANKIENMPPKLPQILLEKSFGIVLIKKIRRNKENIQIQNDEIELIIKSVFIFVDDKIL